MFLKGRKPNSDSFHCMPSKGPTMFESNLGPRKWVRGLKHSPVKTDCENLGCLGWRWLWGDLVAALQYLKQAYKKAGERLFMTVWSSKAVVLNWRRMDLGWMLGKSSLL